MDTVAKILSAIPEPLVSAVITAVFTGLIMFFLQKRIEDSFSRKMSKFNADIQKSLLEHQTKFATHHVKAVETLECLYQKIVVISNQYEKMVYKSTSFYKNNLEFIKSMDLRYLEIQEDLDYLRTESKDFITYFHSNRLFLPNSSIQSIKSIHHRVDALIEHVPYYLELLFDFDDASPEFIFRLHESVEKLGFGSLTIEEHWDLLPLFEVFVEEMNKQTEKLEYLYKSVADID